MRSSEQGINKELVGEESWGRRRRKCGTNGTTRRRRRSITEKVGSGDAEKEGSGWCFLDTSAYSEGNVSGGYKFFSCKKTKGKKPYEQAEEITHHLRCLTLIYLYRRRCKFKTNLLEIYKIHCRDNHDYLERDHPCSDMLFVTGI